MPVFNRVTNDDLSNSDADAEARSKQLVWLFEAFNSQGHHAKHIFVISKTTVVQEPAPKAKAKPKNKPKPAPPAGKKPSKKRAASEPVEEGRTSLNL